MQNGKVSGDLGIKNMWIKHFRELLTEQEDQEANDSVNDEDKELDNKRAS